MTTKIIHIGILYNTSDKSGQHEKMMNKIINLHVFWSYANLLILELCNKSDWQNHSV